MRGVFLLYISSMDGLQELKQMMDARFRLPDAAWNDFACAWQPVSFKRKAVITAAGEIERYLYFVVEGIQRAYYLSEDGTDVTVVFTYPPSFCGVPDSLQLQSPAHYTVETLTASRLLRMGYQQLQELMDAHKSIERMVRLSTAAALYGVMHRQAEIMAFSAEQKFTTFLQRSPHLLNMVPHKYLASYLAIDASTFSKLLSSVRI